MRSVITTQHFPYNSKIFCLYLGIHTFFEWAWRKMFWTLLGYTVIRGFTSPRNSTWFTRHFSSWRVGPGDKTRQIYSAAAIRSGRVMVWKVTTIVKAAGLNETGADLNNKLTLRENKSTIKLTLCHLCWTPVETSHYLPPCCYPHTEKNKHTNKNKQSRGRLR